MPRMRLGRAPLLLVLALVTARACAAIKLTVEPQKQECVEEVAGVEEIQFAAVTSLDITAAFRVKLADGSPNSNARRNIDATLINPANEVIADRKRVWREAKLAAKDSIPGRYRLCFKNQGPSRTAARVEILFFTVTHSDRAAADGLEARGGVGSATRPELAKAEHLTQAHDLLARLATLLRLVRGEQRYIKARMERHIDTSLSTFNRAMAYTLAELATLGVTVAVQITTIHALFKNRRSSRGILGS